MFFCFDLRTQFLGVAIRVLQRIDSIHCFATFFGKDSDSESRKLANEG